MIDANAVLKSYQKKCMTHLQSIRSAMGKDDYEASRQMLEELMEIIERDMNE